MTYQKKKNKIIFIIIYTLTFWVFPSTVFSQIFLNEKNIKKNFQYCKKIQYTDFTQQSYINFIKKKLDNIKNQNLTNKEIKHYQYKINDIYCIVKFQLISPINTIIQSIINIYNNENSSVHKKQQKTFQIKNQFVNIIKKTKLKKYQTYIIYKSINKLLIKPKIVINKIFNKTIQQHFFFLLIFIIYKPY